MALRVTSIDARSALNATGGFLDGFTHSFNPAIGCAYALGECGSFCYAREFAERRLGRGGWGEQLLIKENAPELLARELARAARREPSHPHHVSRLSIFSASTTDPCAGPILPLYRRCLEVACEFPIRRWVIQTRSPAILKLQREIEALGARAIVSFTMETDADMADLVTLPGSPPIAKRRRAFERMTRWNVVRHLAVSPFLPLRDASAFADWIERHASLATVDTFVSGDGSEGRRTARSPFPARLARLGLDWRDESHARDFFQLLQRRIGGRAGWSAEGFRRLATL